MLAAVLLGGMAWRSATLSRFAAGTAGGQLLRATVPLAMIAPAAVMWLQDTASHHGWWSARGGLAVAATLSALLFIAVAAHGARWIDGLQAELRAANAVLEARVAQRTQELVAAQSARALAEATIRARAEFLAKVNHELRTPLNAILGFTYLLQADDDARLDARQQLHLSHLATAGQQLGRLVEDLLDFGVAEAGHTTLQLGATAAYDLAQRGVGLIGPEAASAGIAVHLGPAPDAADVNVDAQRPLQVLVNLLSNAVKYNRPGGSVQVDVQRAAGDVLISVADTGEGIPPARIGQLFVTFNRLGREHGPVAGSGIGLALAQRLVGLMSGRIEVRSELGRGSVFTVRLPAMRAGHSFAE